jgi:hypothetical protein
MSNYNTLNDEYHRLCGEVAHGCYDWVLTPDGDTLPDTLQDAAKAYAALQYAGSTMYAEVAVYSTCAAMNALGVQLIGDGNQYLSLLHELAQDVHNSVHNEQEQPEPAKAKGKEPGKLPEWPDPADVEHLQSCWAL